MDLSEKDIERFWKKVNRPNDEPTTCWEFTGAKDDGGYGRFRVMGSLKLAHRVAYTIAYGPFDDTLNVCHTCDNPPCCRPSHLFLGTSRDNRQDAAQKGRLSYKRKNKPNITDEQAREIREKYRQGGITQKQLAQEHGASREYIGNIIRGVVKTGKRKNYVRVDKAMYDRVHAAYFIDGLTMQQIVEKEHISIYTVSAIINNKGKKYKEFSEH